MALHDLAGARVPRDVVAHAAVAARGRVHRQRGTHVRLACDVVEPMRVEADKFALGLFRKDEIRVATDADAKGFENLTREA